MGVKTKKSDDRSDLGRLYPTPKTYEEKRQDDIRRQQSYRRRWPKFPSFNIALFGSVAFVLMLWFAQNLNGWWFATTDKGMAMSTIFFSFAIGLGVTFLFIAWMRYANSLLYYFKGNKRLFWLLYFPLVFAQIVLWLAGGIRDYRDILWIPLLAALSFLSIFIISRVVISRKA